MPRFTVTVTTRAADVERMSADTMSNAALASCPVIQNCNNPPPVPGPAAHARGASPAA